MVCDKCKKQARWYYTVFLPHQAPGVSGKRCWCPSCADDVPAGTSASGPFALTLEEHLQQKLDEAWTKVSELEKRLKLSTEAQARQIRKIDVMAVDAKGKTQRLNEKVREIRRLNDKIHRLENSVYWGPSYHSMFAQQQAQYTAMMQQQVKAAQMSTRPLMFSAAGLGGLGCYAPNTELMSRKNHEAIVDSLNTQLEAQQENFEKQEEKLSKLNKALSMIKHCTIGDPKCPACVDHIDRVMKETKDG